MSSLFALVYAVSFVCIFVSLINPNLFRKFFKEKTGRKYNAKIFGITCFISFILTGVTAEKDSQSSGDELVVKNEGEETSLEVNEDVVNENFDQVLEDENIFEKSDIVGEVDVSQNENEFEEIVEEELKDDDLKDEKKKKETEEDEEKEEEKKEEEEDEEDEEEENVIDEKKEEEQVNEDEVVKEGSEEDFTIIEDDDVKDVVVENKADEETVDFTNDDELGDELIVEVAEEIEDEEIKVDDSEKYICDCSKTCPNLTFDEAQYQLNVCGCKVRDRDKDGVACEKN